MAIGVLAHQLARNESPNVIAVVELKDDMPCFWRELEVEASIAQIVLNAYASERVVVRVGLLLVLTNSGNHRGYLAL